MAIFLLKQTQQTLFWILFNLIALIYTTIFIQYMWEKYIESPTLVTLASSNLPLHKIHFPGVAICNVNKISKQNATEFAKYLKQFDHENDIQALLTDIQMLGNLYDFNAKEAEKLIVFQEFLEKTDNQTKMFDSPPTILKLHPSCHDKMEKCTWGGEVYDCKVLFRIRMTSDGVCCTFNNIRKFTTSYGYKQNNREGPPTVVQSPQGAGMENGLSVILKNDYDDYFFTTTETTGYMVQIFYPKDFPDRISGSLSEIIVNLGTEALISIDVDVVRSTKALSALPTDMRRCKFETDETTYFGGYRYSDCLVACKLKSIKSLCHCTPIVLHVGEKDPITDCAPIDLPCLNKYTGKWSKYYPIDVEDDALEEEKQDSMNCQACLPACNNVNYHVFPNVVPIITKGNNHTHINVYFDKPFANLLRVDVAMNWYEMLSNFGGVLSLFMGISIISVIEIGILIYRILWYLIYKINKTF